MNSSKSTYISAPCDVAVIGAGHAGIESALACARLGCKTVLFTLSNDAVGNLPCNPSIGGTGKGHLVYEIDALGGEMGRAADKVTLQSRTLNLGKGPAVHSKRIQADRALYRDIMKYTLENTENLILRQAQITEIDFDADGTVRGVVTAYGAYHPCKACIIASGTFLCSRVITGESVQSSGPDGMCAANELSSCLESAGIKLMRFKTGTPPRIHADSIDYSLLELQEGEEDPLPFSHSTPENAFDGKAQIPCYIAYTNEETHKIIRENLHRSPLYGGVIKGTGPRYCPSIEDKVVRFADKERHQLFVEPCGAKTKEIYLQGFSSSLPEEVQMQMLHSIKGFENAVVMRTAYAIEYDCADPTQMRATLEFKEYSGLYGAGQFNGSSGYEEAAAQGLVAGINAAMKIKGNEELVLSRDSSYIGTLIDDLVTKGTNEPYRIMTSRSEYRLLLRQDNARHRLTEHGHRVGLVSDCEYQHFLQEEEQMRAEIERLEKTYISKTPELCALLESKESSAPEGKISLADLIRRPRVSYAELAEFDSERRALPRAIAMSVEIEIKYEGYIKRQISQVKRLEKLEKMKLPEDIDYEKIGGLRIEAVQKLSKIRPLTLGQASRISGVSPADISVLIIRLTGK